ncbi:MAG: 3-hydroxybutyrate dehydrogenase [Syntrophus sp. SKADARSKE-3]|nr:3-hydroxybutyrate dehydrogenase [Syntrophus sp. SKADARSKE-3]
MAKKALKESQFNLQPPDIKKSEILIVKDDNFKPEFVCLVTGAASGIGRATALAVAANGVSVAALDMDEAGGKETVEMAKKLGGRVQFIKTDLTNDANIESCVKQAAKMGSIKFLANIAGLQHIDSVENFPMAKYDLMQTIMLRAPFYLSKLVIPHIKKSKNGVGAIGNMASIHAHICTMNKPVYNITKFGLRGLTQSIAAEGEGKIRSFSVSTGFIKTPLALKQIPAQAQQRGITEEEVVVDVMLGKSRVKEMMNPIEVGNLFVFGFSKHGKYLVGNDLLFDGGVVKTY